MILVFIPGMDGTGELFSPLLLELKGYDHEVVSLPRTGLQNYESLIKSVRVRLPKKDFIIVAESFSGPIAVALAQDNNQFLKGMVFVATFLSNPSKYVLPLARVLPLTFLACFPLSSCFINYLFFDRVADKELIQQFQKTLQSLPSSVLKARLKSINGLSYKPTSIGIPSIYIQAQSDRLVPAKKVKEFEKNFSDLRIICVEGSHFILQSKPKECAGILREFILNVKIKSNG